MHRPPYIYDQLSYQIFLRIFGTNFKSHYFVFDITNLYLKGSKQDTAAAAAAAAATTTTTTTTTTFGFHLTGLLYRNPGYSRSPGKNLLAFFFCFFWLSARSRSLTTISTVLFSTLICPQPPSSEKHSPSHPPNR